MPSFLDDCEWQQRLDEAETATNLTDTNTETNTSSNGLVSPSPYCVGLFFCYSSVNDVSPAFATSSTTTNVTATATIKSEQMMLGLISPAIIYLFIHSGFEQALVLLLHNCDGFRIGRSRVEEW